MSKKPKYSVDQHNNLSIENNGQKLLTRGRFSTDKDNLTFSLANSRKEPLGLTITFSHRFLKKLDARAFLRLQARPGVSKVETGLSIPF
jgi:hypothetical protein